MSYDSRTFPLRSMNNLFRCLCNRNTQQEIETQKKYVFSNLFFASSSFPFLQKAPQIIILPCFSLPLRPISFK